METQRHRNTEDKFSNLFLLMSLCLSVGFGYFRSGMPVRRIEPLLRRHSPDYPCLSVCFSIFKTRTSGFLDAAFPGLYVEPEMHDIPVLHHVLFSFDIHLSRFFYGAFRA